RPKIEAHLLIVVYKLGDSLMTVQDTGGRVWSVALGGDSLVPIVIWRRGVFDLDVFKPGIFAGWLIEVPVYTNKAIGHITVSPDQCVFRNGVAARATSSSNRNVFWPSIFLISEAE